MKEEVEKIKKEIEEIDKSNELALDEIHDLRKERNELLLAIVGLLLNK